MKEARPISQDGIFDLEYGPSEIKEVKRPDTPDYIDPQDNPFVDHIATASSEPVPLVTDNSRELTNPLAPPLPEKKSKQENLLKDERNAEEKKNEVTIPVSAKNRDLIPALKQTLKRMGLDKQGWTLKVRRTAFGNIPMFAIARKTNGKNEEFTLSQNEVRTKTFSGIGSRVLLMANAKGNRRLKLT